MLKQAQEHDPCGQFIRQWCPEFEALPDVLLFEPWKITVMEELMYDFVVAKKYFEPIVDTSQSYRQASDRLWAWRKKPEVLREAQRILRRHLSANDSS